MAGMQLRCDVVQGFNFQKDVQTPIGHITALTISGQKFENKLMAQDPLKVKEGTNVGVVGVISNIRWNGGYTEPITFTCQVSADNKETAAILTHKDLSNIDVEFAFNVYEFDASAETYYPAFHSNKTVLQARIEKASGELELDIDSTPSPQIASPINYELYLSVMPIDGKVQNINLAVSESEKFEKSWGTSTK